MDDDIKLGVIGSEEMTDIFAALEVNADDVVVLAIKMLLEVCANKALVTCNQDFHFPHLSLSYSYFSE